MKKITSSLLVGILTIFLSAAAFAGVIGPDLEATLSTAKPGEEIPVILSLTDRVDLTAFHDRDKGKRRARIISALQGKANATQGPVLAAVLNKKVIKLKRFWIFNGISFQARAAAIRGLANIPGVESIRLDATLSAPEPSPAAAAVPEWNISAVRAPELWALGYTGSGMVVANMDTGVDPEHQDLAGKWRGGANSWFDPYGQYDSPHDANGHGTQTMGIMVGGDLGGTAIGVAPDAQWIAVKIFDNQDRTTLSNIHQGFQWLLDPDGSPATDDAPDVVNNSWGFELNAGECITEFEPDIEALKAMDIGVVFSGGNRGPYAYSSVSPANNADSFAVGAVDYALDVARFSSRGPSACDGSIYPEVVAPGVDIRTADLTYSGTYPGSYAAVTGTSFAAPHVAGVMALLMESFPAATTTELETALQESALDFGDPGPDNDYGYGLLDAAAAYEALVAGAPVCTDSDGDGFFVEGGACGLADCNDNDAAINPEACDIKADGIDQDCDGADRTRGKPCPVADDGNSDPLPDDGGDTVDDAEKKDTCTDGLDNDGDGLFDCDDPDCRNNKSCR